MIWHYVKLYIHSLSKDKLFSLINIVGLSVALASCLIMALYIRYELSYDRYHEKAAGLYRVSLESVDPTGAVSQGGAVFYPVLPLLKENFPDIATIARVRPYVAMVKYQDKSYRENRLQLVDGDFFSLFDVTWLAGNPRDAFATTNDVVITASFADKYFGHENPLGKTLDMDGKVPLRVSGVIEDLPGNTHLRGDAFINMAIRDVLEPVESRNREWYFGIYYTYLYIQDAAQARRFEDALSPFSQANIPPAANVTFTLTLDKVIDIHLNPKIGDMKPAGSKIQLVVLALVAAATILTACFNFMNLSLARLSNRRREMAVRKALGARRGQLLHFYLGETLFYALLAVVLAIALVELSQPLLTGYMGVAIAPFRLGEAWSWQAMSFAMLLISLLAGLYPACIMSGESPATVLKQRVMTGFGKTGMKNLLVVFQFSIAIFLIIATAVIFFQLRYSRELELGFRHDDILIVRTSEVGSLDNVGQLKEQLVQHADVRGGALSYSTPLRSRNASYTFVTTGNQQASHRFALMSVDFDYFSVYDIGLVAGRYFDPRRSDDLFRASKTERGYAGNVILSESGARKLGWTPEEALGQLVTRSDDYTHPVIGVVRDTRESAINGVYPTMYLVPENLLPGRYLSLRVDNPNPSAVLAYIDTVWKTFNGNEPIERYFLNQTIQKLYQPQERQMTLSIIFALVVIVINCMGLFGISALNAIKRTKEIGIRKVMGGSVWSIIVLLTNEFSKLVLISNVIAWPVAWYAMNQWLSNFAYRIDLTPLIFIGSGLIALCIAWVTVGGTAAKAASQKPVLALRYE